MFTNFNYIPAKAESTKIITYSKRFTFECMQMIKILTHFCYMCRLVILLVAHAVKISERKFVIPLAARFCTKFLLRHALEPTTSKYLFYFFFVNTRNNVRSEMKNIYR